MNDNETDVEVRFGGSKEEAYCKWYMCKKCGGDHIMFVFKFCPYCGRKIVRGGDD